MPVKLQGQHSFPAPREVVWQALVDPQILARTLPGAERLVAVGENRFEGQINLKVGPVQGQFAGSVELSEVRPLEGYRLELKGQGATGFVEGAGRVWLEGGEGGLEDGDDGSTTLHYDIDSQIGGRIAGVGQRLLDSSAKVLTRQALEGLGRQIEAMAPAGEEVPTGTEDSPIGTGGRPEQARPLRPEPGRVPPDVAAGLVPAASRSPPSQTEFAAEFAKGLAAELVPRERRPWLFAGLLLVAAVVAALLLRGCGP